VKGYVLEGYDDRCGVIAEWLVDGVILRNLLSSSHLTSQSKPPEWWDSTRKVITFVGTVMALRYLHENKIVHQDISSANIVLDKHHNPRLGDFAKSRLCGLGLDETLEMSIIYKPPEALMTADDPNTTFDIYSLGILLYEVIINPSQLKTKCQRLQAFGLLNNMNNNKEKLPIPNETENISKELVCECWDTDPKKRPTCEAILKRLDDANYKLLPNVDADMVRSYVHEIETFHA
jgi:serine/threonine protein kinase